MHAARFQFHGARLDPADPVHNAYVALELWRLDGWQPWTCQGVALASRR
jgi:hypothetical protein